MFYVLWSSKEAGEGWSACENLAHAARLATNLRDAGPHGLRHEKVVIAKEVADGEIPNAKDIGCLACAECGYDSCVCGDGLSNCD